MIAVRSKTDDLIPECAFLQTDNVSSGFPDQIDGTKGPAMAEIDNDTLLVSLQAVYESINRLEALLVSETLKDPETMTELLMSYDEAFKVLKSVYREQLAAGADLPPIEGVVFDKA